jgi:hypothetical protein
VTVSRKFASGATRNDEKGKHDYEGFLSPLVVERYGHFMNKHRHLEDGTLRASDNWQKGIPFDVYMKSGFRHFMDWWKEHRGHHTADGVEGALCALMFNTMGYLHEHLRVKDHNYENDPDFNPEYDGAYHLIVAELEDEKEEPEGGAEPPKDEAYAKERDLLGEFFEANNKPYVAGLPTPVVAKVVDVKPNQPLLYLSGQLTNGGTELPYSERAVDEMNLVGADLMRRGFAVYMPQLTVHLPNAERFNGLSVQDAHKAWLKMDKTIIARCDGLVRVENGPSKGADEEIAFAKSLALPVLYTVPDLSRGSSGISETGGLASTDNFRQQFQKDRTGSYAH